MSDSGTLTFLLPFSYRNDVFNRHHVQLLAVVVRVGVLVRLAAAHQVGGDHAVTVPRQDYIICNNN